MSNLRILYKILKKSFFILFTLFYETFLFSFGAKNKTKIDFDKRWAVDIGKLGWIGYICIHFYLSSYMEGSSYIQCSRAIQNVSVYSLFSFPFHLFFPITAKRARKNTKRNKTGKPLRMILHFKSAALDFQWHIDDTLKKWNGSVEEKYIDYKYSNFYFLNWVLLLVNNWIGF